MQLLTPLVAAAFLASNVLAHPGHDARAEMAERAAFMQNNRRNLSQCASKMKARGMDKQMVDRRSAMATKARKQRNLPAGKTCSIL